MKIRNALFHISILLCLLLVAGCQPMPAPAATGDTAMVTAAPGNGYPVTIENCGRTLTFDQAPQRPIAIYQTATEFMLALGLGDRLVATTQFEANPLPSQAEAFAALPEPWERPVPREVLISAKPDFVFAGYETYDLNAERGLATIADLEAAGAQVYIISGNCAATATDVTVEAVFTDLRNLGQIFGIAPEAEAIIAEMQAKLSAIESQIAGQPVPQVAFLDIGEGGTPVWAYANGIYKDLIERAGGKNIFDDQAEQFVEISAEEVASRNPDVFVVVDSPYGAPAAGKLDLLYQTFPNATATQQQRSALILEMNTLPGVRVIDAVVALAQILHPDLAATSSPSTYPVTIENCGNTLTFDKAPARVASLYSVTTELLLRLGLEDRIVAAANFGELLPDDLQPAYQSLNLVGEGFIIPKEVLLTQKPDLVMDNQPDWFYSAENGFATVEEITGSGAQIYSITAKCGGGRVDAQFADIYTDILNMGKIFGVSDQAEALITEMQTTVDAVTAKVAGQPPLQVMIYDAGEGPLGVFGPGSYDAILRLVGGENAFADLAETYAQVSIEAVASRAIDVVIVGGYDDTGEARADFIRQTFPNMAAVKNNRVVVIEYGLMNPGVRNHLGVEAFAQALYPEAFE